MKKIILQCLFVFANISIFYTQITWTVVDAPEQNCDWQSITYGNGTFVAISKQMGTNKIITSNDGNTWTGHPEPSFNFWTDVTFGNGIFVAVGGLGTQRVMTSPDGANWTLQTAPLSNWSSVTYGNGLFVAVANNGTDKVMTSPDGITWNAQSSTSDTWISVDYANGIFVALSGKSMMTSTNGNTWTDVTIPFSNVQQWKSTTYGNGTWVSVSPISLSCGNVMTSTDGVNWNAFWSGTTNNAAGAHSVAYGSGTFVAVGTSNTHQGIWTSSDGTNWTLEDSPTPLTGTYYDFTSITYGNGRFIAVSSSGAAPYGTQKILVSNLITSGTTEQKNELEFEIYPNPAKDMIKIDNVTIGSLLNIKDMTGKIIYSSTIEDKQTIINTSGFENSMYLVQILNNNIISNRKLIINR